MVSSTKLTKRLLKKSLMKWKNLSCNLKKKFFVSFFLFSLAYHFRCSFPDFWP